MKTIEPDLVLSKNQEIALSYWCDNVTDEILFGGAKGGGKSYLMASLIFGDALLYPETFYFIARAQLTDLRKYTIPSIEEVFKKQFKIPIDKYARYNGQDNFYRLQNGSRVYLLACEYTPSDPMFERFGSMQMTRGAMEEGGEIHYLAKQNLKLSIGRVNNEKYGLKAKLLIVGNPKKNWMKSEFVIPFRDGKLPENKKYIQALAVNNPFREPGYDEVLNSITDKTARQRLIMGDWDYGDDDPNQLCSYDAILDCFTNDHIKPTGQRYISADLAMQGRDRFIAGFRDGGVIEIALDEQKSTGKGIENSLKALMTSRGVSHSHMVADSDGLGSYLGSYLENIKEFHGGAAAISKEYAKLKDECAYKLAEMINNRLLKIICTEDQKQKVIEELELLKAASIDNDTQKKSIIKKEQMKAIIRRSPDYLDMLIMMMYFELNISSVIKGWSIN